MKMGGRIAQRLAELGWTQVDLLNRVDGLNVGTLSAMILRDSQRSQHSEAIARALGVAHAWLQTGDGPMVPPAVNQKVDIAPAPACPLSSISAADYARLPASDRRAIDAIIGAYLAGAATGQKGGRSNGKSGTHDH